MQLGLAFSDEQVRRIYDRALEVVETIGLAVDDGDVRARLLAAGGFSARGDRVVIERQAVEAALAARNAEFGIDLPSPRPAPAAGGMRLSVGTRAGWTVPPGADDVRPMTTADVIDGIGMLRGLDDPHLEWRTIGTPQDVPAPLRTAHAQMLSCVHAGRPTYLDVSTDRDMAVDLAFHEAMGVPRHLPCHLPSPLRLAGQEFDLALRWSDRVGEISIGSMPQAGVTAPVSVPGLLIQSAAEMLGANAALRALLPGKRITFDLGAHATNFRTGGMVYGSPGALLVEAARFQVRGWLGCGWGGGRFMRTHARLPGPQSAADKAAGGMLGALLGCPWVGLGGTIGMDEVWSAEQLLLDAEIRRFVTQAAGGFVADDDAFEIDVIRECADAGDFLASPDTAGRFRQLAWDGRLFDYGMLNAWLASDRRSDRARLTEMAADLTGRDTAPALDDDRRRAVMAVYERARRRWRKGR